MRVRVRLCIHTLTCVCVWVHMHVYMYVYLHLIILPNYINCLVILLYTTAVEHYYRMNFILLPLITFDYVSLFSYHFVVQLQMK